MAAPLIGAPFKQNVRQQLQVRSKKRASQNLTDRDLAVQHGSTGWARISSGVIIEGDTEKAKNNVLQGGVLSKLKQGFNQTGKNSSYTKDEALGFRPIPGIDSIEIATQNAQGTIRKTDVQFKVNSLEQLETFERLYLRPGFTVLLEYGHSSYYDNDENIITDIPTVDFFGNTTFEAVAEKTLELQESSAYNYDAIFGLIMNFQYSFNMQGGYDCTFYIISRGSLLESILAISSGDTKNITKTNSTLGGAVDFLTDLADKKSEEAKQDSKSEVIRILNVIYKETGAQGSLKETIKSEFPSVFTSEGSPFYLDRISTDIPNSGKKVYITFNHLMMILNNTVNLVVNKKTEFIRFAHHGKINSNFLTYNNHFSSNPNVCLLKKQPADKNLFFGAIAGEKFPPQTGKGDQIYTDILLDVSFLSRTLGDLAKGDKKNKTVVDFLKIVFEKVGTALGDINIFDFHYLDLPEEGEPTPTIYIVDRRITPTLTQLRGNILPCYGKGGLLSNISVTSKISNELTTMMALGAQASGTNLSNYGGLALSYNKGLADKFKDEIVDAVNEANDPENSSDAKDYEKKFETITDAVKTFIKGKTFKESDGTNLEEPHKFIANSDIAKGSNPISGTLPFELSFTMQGISGLVIGQGFKLQEGILPSHVQKTAGFIIKSINHSIQSNMWTTDISAYMTLSTPDPEKNVKQFYDKSLDSKTQQAVDDNTVN